MDWIQHYFETAVTTTKKSSDEQQRKVVHVTNRPPLYLQHSGHSRTVIGIEVLKDGKRNLIMFDPGRRMLRSYRNKPDEEEIDDIPSLPAPSQQQQQQQQQSTVTFPEDDMDESPLSSVNGDDIDDDDVYNPDNHSSMMDPHDDDDDDDDDDDTDEVSTPNESSSTGGNNTNTNSSSPRLSPASVPPPPSSASTSTSTSALSTTPPPPPTTSFASRLLSGITQRTHLPANLLRPFRVDAKTIAKNKQYQLLVLGDVIDERSTGGQLYWDETKGYLLNELERQDKKNVTSIVMTL
jgi:hypothetical protein